MPAVALKPEPPHHVVLISRLEKSHADTYRHHATRFDHSPVARHLRSSARRARSCWPALRPGRRARKPPRRRRLSASPGRSRPKVRSSSTRRSTGPISGLIRVRARSRSGVPLRLVFNVSRSQRHELLAPVGRPRRPVALRRERTLFRCLGLRQRTFDRRAAVPARLPAHRFRRERPVSDDLSGVVRRSGQCTCTSRSAPPAIDTWLLIYLAAVFRRCAHGACLRHGAVREPRTAVDAQQRRWNLSRRRQAVAAYRPNPTALATPRHSPSGCCLA